MENNLLAYVFCGVPDPFYFSDNTQKLKNGPHFIGILSDHFFTRYDRLVVGLIQRQVLFENRSCQLGVVGLHGQCYVVQRDNGPIEHVIHFDDL